MASRVAFSTVNLFEVNLPWLLAAGPFQRILLDPPREGAQALCQAIAAMSTSEPDVHVPRRIVYVSCNPATLARDAAILVHEGGWRLSRAGIINMFPHTGHVESIAVFDHHP